MKKPSFKSKTVLLIDDNEIDNFINQKMIEASLFAENVFIYTSATGALEHLVNLSNNFEMSQDIIPDYIFLDINMPVMDGHQFLREFENLDDRISKHCKIVVLTSSLNPIDKEKVNEFDSVINFLNKPLTESEIAKIKTKTRKDVNV